MASSWYYLQAGVSQGPVSRQELDRLVNIGELSSSTLVWRDELDDWVAYESIRLPAPPSTPRTPTPPGSEPATSGRSPVTPPPIAKPSVAPPRDHRQRSHSSQAPLIVGVVALGMLVVVLLASLVYVLWPDRSTDVASAGRTTVATATDMDRQASTSTEATTPTSPQPAGSQKYRSGFDAGAATDELTVGESDNTITTGDEGDADSSSNPGDVTGDGSIEPVATSSGRSSDTDPIPDPNRREPPLELAPGPGADNAPESEPKAPDPDVAALGKPETLYQEIQIQRTPQFSVAGTVFAQDLKYKLLSELRVSPFNEDGRRQVDQIIQRAVLIEADDMSRAMFTKSLKELEGWQFSATLNRRGEVIGWHSGPKDGRETVEVKPEGMEGFLVTSVMDEDGWKELTQLSFFVPDPKTDGETPWTRQMTHDYGPLGNWYGLTHFRRNETAKGITRYAYEHELTYQPPEEGIEGLPFNITDARFLPEVAEGYLDFLETAQRVESAHETFVLKGQLATEILGQRATIDTVEQQTMTLRLSDEKTW